MLIEFKNYLIEMIKEHKNEINGLVLIQRQFKKLGKISQKEDIKARIKKLTGLQNKEHNFILFLEDYLKVYKK